MSREEKIRETINNNYHPNGMTLVAIELAALNDLLAPVLAEKFFAAVNAPSKPAEDLVPRRLFDCSKGEEVWIRGTVLSERIDQDGEVYVEFHGIGKYVACETLVKSV